MDSEIEGWLFKEEGNLLEKYAKDSLCIIELGCYKGRSTNYLQNGCSRDTIIYSVDTFDCRNTTITMQDVYSIFIKNHIVYSWFNVIPVKMSTEYFANIFEGSCDLLFIDADHSYEGVKRDFEMFNKFLSGGAIIIFHDAFGENGEEENTPWEGVTKFYKELLDNSEYKFVEKCRRCAVFQKV